MIRSGQNVPAAAVAGTFWDVFVSFNLSIT